MALHEIPYRQGALRLANRSPETGLPKGRGWLDVEILRMPVANPKLISVPLFSEHLVLMTPADVPYRPKNGIRGFRNSGFAFVSPAVSDFTTAC
jgi:DNA-binding transcriptional LysR family regulator